jgi:hypothetical protein
MNRIKVLYDRDRVVRSSRKASDTLEPSFIISVLMALNFQHYLTDRLTRCVL